jgi:hypothetical protein
MCDTPAALLEHAQVIVIGCDSPEAQRVLEGLRSDQKVIDLTRTALKERNKEQDEAKAKVAA